MAKNITLSVVVPVHNEALGLRSFHKSLRKACQKAVGNSYEVIYVDDGSNDNSLEVITALCSKDNKARLVSLSRNFGKENAMAAGISQAHGKAIMTVDGDGQHPLELIPQFVSTWLKGAQVVIGVRDKHASDSRLKQAGSSVFYTAFNKIAGRKMIPGSTDYRLIDQAVQAAFLKLRENGRFTRGLIDWLGFKREFIYFEASPRREGEASYSLHKLVALATDSFISLTPRPLYLFGIVGVFITLLSFVLGMAVIIEQLLLGDPANWNFTGTAMLGILILFLVGIVLMSQGILSLYISRINEQSKQRPLYVINHKDSLGIDEKDTR